MTIVEEVIKAANAVVSFRASAKFKYLDPHGADLVEGVAAWMDHIDDITGETNHEVQGDLLKWAQLVRELEVVLLRFQAAQK